ncbi:MAG: Fe-S cluster assembly protein SufD [Bacteroidales bacterium]|nr:Fe-S cluster assembly protein SufD [Bacteroidales bacterium]MCB9000269.1 Fe-S cluster assembly protein SufD [Bacteroidales bacterium]MCB9012827.1 Fe-S cluster assembly protein SufD [Bacteroidales bacterium]
MPEIEKDMNVDVKLLDTREMYGRLYSENQNQIFSGSSDYVNSFREKAIESFKKTGLPTKKDERYKNTPVGEYYSQELHQNFIHKKIEFEEADIFKCDIPELDTRVILVVNGFYHTSGTRIIKMENGAIYGSLSAASKEFPELFRKHYAQYSDFSNDGVSAINTAFAQDGVFLYVPKNTICDKTFQIINLLLSEESLMIHHRNLIILEEGAEAKVLICDHTLSEQQFLTNSVTEIYTGKNASLDITRVQNENNKATQITNSFALQMADSRLSSNYITLHGGKVRNNVYVNLEGEGADNNSMGLFLLDGNQHVDNYTYINHVAPNCTSNQLYKGILDDNSTGSFNGKIHVWKDAQHTQAYQRNNNILLTDTAKMNTRPQLEIYADDVKCSHGATVGQLDTDALFYLRSRGIPQKESLLLLMYAFAHSVISEIKLEALRERITELVDKRLRGELSHCNNCHMKCQ